jgi:hypothetical protein
MTSGTKWSGYDLQGHEPLAGVGQPDGQRARVEVERSCRIQGVAVLPDYELVVDGGQVPDVVELPKPPSLTRFRKYRSLSARTKLSGVTVMGTFRL